MAILEGVTSDTKTGDQNTNNFLVDNSFTERKDLGELTMKKSGR